MGDTMSMSSICRGQFSQMGSQRLLLLFRKDAHSRIATLPACAPGMMHAEYLRHCGKRTQHPLLQPYAADASELSSCMAQCMQRKIHTECSAFCCCRSSTGVPPVTPHESMLFIQMVEGMGAPSL